MDHELAIGQLKACIEQWSSQDDPVLGWVRDSFIDSNQRMAWLLAIASLNQGLSATRLVELANQLSADLPTDSLWRLPAPERALIDSSVQKAVGRLHWPLERQVAGILWSVGKFIRRHDPLVDWISTQSSFSIWNALGEIFYMGRESPVRSKALWFLHWLQGAEWACLSPSFSKWDGKGPRPHPTSSGARRAWSLVHPEMKAWQKSLSPTERLNSMQKFYGKLSSQPERASHALQFFLEHDGDSLACQRISKGCTTCPLQHQCPIGRNEVL